MTHKFIRNSFIYGSIIASRSYRNLLIKRRCLKNHKSSWLFVYQFTTFIVVEKNRLKFLFWWLFAICEYITRENKLFKLLNGLITHFRETDEFCRKNNKIWNEANERGETTVKWLMEWRKRFFLSNLVVNFYLNLLFWPVLHNADVERQQETTGKRMKKIIIAAL